MRRSLAALAAISTVLGIAGTAQSQDLLVVGEGVPATLNFDGATASHLPSQTGMENLMEPLVYFKKREPNEEGIRLLDYNAYEGRLAESWSFDAANLTWTFNLRRGVKGCNGATFDADDVLYTFARGKSVSGASPIAWFLSNVASIAGFTPAVFGDSEEAKAARKLGDEVRKVDSHTVQIKQSAPNELFLPVLAIFFMGIYDKEIMEANATVDDPWSHKFTDLVDAPGFGPYCLDTWKKGDVFTVRANVDYFAGKPYFDRVVYKKVSQSANRATVLHAGQAQLAERLTPKEYDTLRRAKGIKVGGAYSNVTLPLVLNWKTPPFDNPKVRQAIAHAIPYDEIIRIGYFGQAKRWRGHVPSSYPGYHEPSTQYVYDPDKAKALLAEAGYPNGDGLENFPVAFELIYEIERESTLGPVATVIRTALRNIGIPVDLGPIPSAQFADRHIVKKDLPFHIGDQAVPLGADVGYAVQLHFLSVEKGGLSNWMNYSNERVDGLWSEAKVEPDVTKRNALLADIQEQIAKDVAWIPIVEWKYQFAFDERLKGVTLHASTNTRFNDLFMEE